METRAMAAARQAREVTEVRIEEMSKITTERKSNKAARVLGITEEHLSHAEHAAQAPATTQSSSTASMLSSLQLPTLGLSREHLVHYTQLYNLAVAAAVTVGYLTTPDASLNEYGADIGVHILSFLVNEHMGQALPKIGLGLNAARLAGIGGHALAGDSTISAILNLLDVANHGLNLLAEATALQMSEQFGQVLGAPSAGFESMAAEIQDALPETAPSLAEGGKLVDRLHAFLAPHVKAAADDFLCERIEAPGMRH